MKRITAKRSCKSDAIALGRAWVEEKMKGHDEPQREGLPKGTAIGFSLKKQKAVHFVILRGSLRLKDIAQLVKTSEATMGMWRSEEEFKRAEIVALRDFTEGVINTLYKGVLVRVLSALSRKEAERFATNAKLKELGRTLQDRLAGIGPGLDLPGMEEKALFPCLSKSLRYFNAFVITTFFDFIDLALAGGSLLESLLAIGFLQVLQDALTGGDPRNMRSNVASVETEELFMDITLRAYEARAKSGGLTTQEQGELIGIMRFEFGRLFASLQSRQRRRKLLPQAELKLEWANEKAGVGKPREG